MYNIDTLIKNALEEDIGKRDHSSFACISKNEMGKAKLVIKENGILAGVGLAKKIFKLYDNSLEIYVNSKLRLLIP